MAGHSSLHCYLGMGFVGGMGMSLAWEDDDRDVDYDEEEDDDEETEEDDYDDEDDDDDYDVDEPSLLGLRMGLMLLALGAFYGLFHPGAIFHALAR